MANSIANAWITILPETSKIAPGVKKAFGEVDAIATAQGKSAGGKMGSSLSSTLGSTLKTTLKGGLGAVGLAAGGALAGSIAKGMSRLTAIEGAEAKLTGLGNSAADVAQIMDNALASVKGTAYGLGEAASTSAMLVAAGVQSGKELETTLKTVADTAAISGRSMADVGTIFGSIAARGKLQGDDMLQLMSSGVPVLQMVAEELGTTSAAVSEMVTDGQVDFATFEKAMRRGMGDSAQEMGNTFVGAMDNMGAAMGRFGEALMGPVFNAAPALMASVGSVFDSMATSMAPAAEQIESVLVPAFASIGEVLESKVAPWAGEAAASIGEVAAKAAEVVVDPAMWESIGSAFSTIGDAAGRLAPSLATIAANFATVASNISVATWEALGNVLNAVAPLVEQVLVPALEKLSQVAAENPELVQAVVVGFLGLKAAGAVAEPIRSVASTLKDVAGAASFAGSAVKSGGLAAGLLDIAGKSNDSNKKLAGMGKTVVSMTKGLAGISMAGSEITPFFTSLGSGLMKVVKLANPWVAGISLAASALTWFFTGTEPGREMWNSLVATLKTGWEWLSSVFASGWEWLSTQIPAAWDGLVEKLKSGWESLQSLFEQGKGALEAVATAFMDVMGSIADFFQPLWDAFASVAGGIFESIKDVLATIWLTIVDFLTGNWSQIPDTLAAGWDAIKTHLSEAFAEAWEYIVDFAGKVKEKFTEIRDAVAEKITAMREAVVVKIAELIAEAVVKFVELKDGVVAKFIELKDGVVAKFIELKNTAIQRVVEFALGVRDKITELKNNIIETFASLPGKIGSFFESAGTWLVEAGKNIMSGLWDGLKSIWNSVSEWLNGIAAKVTSVFAGTTRDAEEQINTRRSGGGQVSGYAAGGRLPIHGPGTGTVDGILGVDYRGMPIARVNAGEFVVNAHATKKFLPLLQSINSGLISPSLDEYGLPGYASGGVVSARDLLRFARGEAVNGVKAPRSLEGAPYVWSGGLLANWGDCSGAMSGLAALAVGADVNGRKFSTADEGAWLSQHGFSTGMGGHNSLSIGYLNGGPGGGHTSGTIIDETGARTNVEMGGGRGNGQIGGAAAGADHSQYTDLWHIALSDVSAAVGDALENSSSSESATIDWGEASTLASEWDKDVKRRRALAALKVFDTGGVFHAGTAAVNLSGKPEVIINNNQLQAINKLANNVGALVQRIGNGAVSAAHDVVGGAKDVSQLLKIAGFGKIAEYVDPTVTAYEKLEDALVIHQDALSAVSQAETLLGQARESGDPEKIAAAEQELTKARGVASSAAKAAGFAQIELVFTILQTVGSVFKQIWEGQMRAQVGVKQAIADSLKSVQQWTALVDKQRETVSKLQQDVVNDQIALVKSTWDVRLAQADVVRAQLEGVKSVAEAEAALQAERERVARQAMYDYEDLSLAYDRYRYAEKRGLADRLAGYVAVTPEILALEHEVNAARLQGLSQQYSASLAALEATHAQHMAALNLAQSQLQLTQQSALLAQMQQQYMGMSQTQALYGSNTAALYAEKAAAEGRANRGLFGWIGSFFTDPLGTLKYAFGGGIQADRQYAESLGKQIAEREAAGKGIAQTLDPGLEAQIKRLFAMGLDEQAQNLIKASSLGDADRALMEAQEDQSALSIAQQVEALADSQKRLAALVDFERQAQPLREQIAAFDAGAAAHQYSADAIREENPAVKAALEALAVFEGENASRYAASARGEQTVAITIPAQDVYTREQMDALLAGVGKIPGIELRLETLETPAKPSATDIMAITGA